MDDLSHWDFLHVFSAHEAACLIRGIDPNCVAVDDPRIHPILKAMENAYQNALSTHRDDRNLDEMRGGLPKRHLDFVFPVKDRRIFSAMKRQAEVDKFARGNLYSWRITAFYEQVEAYTNGLQSKHSEALFELDLDRFNRWLDSDIETSFSLQMFERDELYLWLERIGQTSIYKFKLDTPSTTSQTRTISFKGTSKRDTLTPIIELASSKCRNGMDVAELWPNLQSLARQKTPPLLGLTEQGIQYLDDSDTPREFTKKALRERLRRAR